MGHKNSGPALILTGIFLLFQSCGEFTGLGSPEKPDTGDLPEFRLYLPDEDLATLQDSVTFKRYAGCRYESGWDTGQAAIRVRGFTSRMVPKKSFTLKTEEKGHTVKQALDAGGDVWISYSLIMYAYRLAGLPAPEFRPVALFLNDEYLGYYNIIRLYDEELNSIYGSSGELFKVRLYDMGRDYPAEGDSEKKFPSDNDYSRLTRLLVNAAHMKTEDWIPWIEENADLEQMAAYMVIRDYFGMEDTYETNFYLHFDEKSRILPWDNDHNYTYSPIGGNNILTTRMLESPVFQGYYRDQFNSLFLQPGTENIIDDLRSHMNELAALLDTPATAEPALYLDYASFLSEQSHIDQFLTDRGPGILSAPGWADFFAGKNLPDKVK